MFLSGGVLQYRLFCLPRRGNSAEECQDAAAADPERGRFALADGAGESSFAALWARLLVEGFVRHSTPPADLPVWLPQLQQQWEAEVRRAPAGAALPWYLEAGMTRGAFATFLAVSLGADGWQALAVGDSCLFQVRDDALLRAFPLASTADFGNSPWLIGSRTSPAEVAGKQALHAEGDWQPGDMLLLMTDALAAWLLGQVEQGGRPWRQLPPLLQANQPDAAFALWVEALRDSRQLRNDDVTLSVISL